MKLISLMRAYKLFRERTSEDDEIDRADIEAGKDIPIAPVEPHIPFGDRPGRKDIRISGYPQNQ